jgi:hypothetical protein
MTSRVLACAPSNRQPHRNVSGGLIGPFHAEAVLRAIKRRVRMGRMTSHDEPLDAATSFDETRRRYQQMDEWWAAYHGSPQEAANLAKAAASVRKLAQRERLKREAEFARDPFSAHRDMAAKLRKTLFDDEPYLAIDREVLEERPLDLPGPLPILRALLTDPEWAVLHDPGRRQRARRTLLGLRSAADHFVQRDGVEETAAKRAQHAATVLKRNGWQVLGVRGASVALSREAETLALEAVGDGKYALAVAISEARKRHALSGARIAVVDLLGRLETPSTESWNPLKADFLMKSENALVLGVAEDGSLVELRHQLRPAVDLDTPDGSRQARIYQ